MTETTGPPSPPDAEPPKKRPFAGNYKGRIFSTLKRRPSTSAVTMVTMNRTPEEWAALLRQAKGKGQPE